MIQKDSFFKKIIKILKKILKCDINIEEGGIMFTGITLKNYKSLIDFTVDLTGRKGITKHLVLVYGENGIGKTTFVNAFCTLYQLLNTRVIKDKILYMLEPKGEDWDYTRRFLLESSDISYIIKDCKTSDSIDNMSLKYEFSINNKNCNYYIETDNSRVVREKMDFAINKNMVNIFDISDENIYLVSSLFNDEAYFDEIKNNILKFWGKHTFLSLLAFEIEDKNSDYIEKVFSTYIRTILTFLFKVSIKYNKLNWSEFNLLGSKYNLLLDYESNSIPRIDENKLDRAEELLTKYFGYFDKRIVRALYKREYSDKKINYSLYFEKNICGRILPISIFEESTGIQNLLGLLPFILSAIEGNVIIVDEFDNGIHDLLTEKIILELLKGVEFRGQIIITTHNTRLMESNISNDLLYILKYAGDKKVLKPITSIIKLQKNNNVRKVYNSGDLGGIPDVDLKGMSKELKELIDSLNL